MGYENEYASQTPESVIKKIIENLADACAGYSQVPSYMVGMALVGQVNQGLPAFRFSVAQYREAYRDWYAARWDDSGLTDTQLEREVVKFEEGLRKAAQNIPDVRRWIARQD